VEDDNPDPKKHTQIEVDENTPYEGKSLIKGDYGLAATYWVGGVLGSFIGGNALELSLKTGKLSTIFVVFISLVLYMTPVLIGVWNAARRYQGKTLWAVLAKIIVVLSCISFLRQAWNLLSWF